MRKLRITLFLVLISTAAIVITSFKRVYVFPADGLLELTAVPSSTGVTVSGALKSSGAKIVKITTTRDGDEALVRIYGDAISPTDNPKCCPGTFSTSVATAGGLRDIGVGDSTRFITVGTLFGIPLRAPRWSKSDAACRIVWRAP